MIVNIPLNPFFSGRLELDCSIIQLRNLANTLEECLKKKIIISDIETENGYEYEFLIYN